MASLLCGRLLAGPVVQAFHSVAGSTFSTCGSGPVGGDSCSYFVTGNQVVFSQAQGPGGSFATLQSEGGTSDGQLQIKSSDLSQTDNRLGTGNRTLVADFLTMQVDFPKLELLGLLPGN